MYNVYKDGEKVMTTDKCEAVVVGLGSGKTYTIGVSQVIGGKESEITTIQTTTEAENEEVEEVDIAEYHTGGGWYELPSGEKVQGRENAIDALKDGVV